MEKDKHEAGTNTDFELNNNLAQPPEESIDLETWPDSDTVDRMYMSENGIVIVS